MIRSIVPYVALATLAIACGGASINTGADQNPDMSPGSFATYAIADADSAPPTGFQRSHVGTEIMERRISRALRRALDEKGYREAPRESAEMVICFGMGVRQDVVGSTSGAERGWTSTQVNAHDDTAIVVDVLKADGSTQVWHGWAEGAGRVGPDDDLEHIVVSAVDQLMRSFPSHGGGGGGGGEGN